MNAWLILVAGLAFLVAGGELLVRGAVQVAARLGVSPLLIGLTLVGFGTSFPELVTSVQAAWSGSPGIAYGNIVGSNIANILLILGISTLLAPILVKSSVLKRDGVVMVAVAVTFAALSAILPMGTLLGTAFVAALAIYVFMAFRQERVASETSHGALYDKSEAAIAVDPAFAPAEKAGPSMALSMLIALVGLGLIVVGGAFLVDSAVEIARAFGVSETTIGLTIVAVGTSMPELVTSVMAAIRKEGEVAFGNVVGSNIYNILGIGGITALIAPTQVPPEIVSFDNLVMIAVSLLLIPIAYTGRRIVRWEGALLLAGYFVYLAILWP